MKGLAVALFALALHANSAFAQTASSSGSAEPAAVPATPAASAPAAGPQVDPEKLPVSIDRIRQQLLTAPATRDWGVRIHETVQVVGVAPKIELWNPETAKLATGPVPYGAPTHKEFIDLVTPQEFKTYPADINALIQWLLAHLAEKVPQ